MVRSPFAYHATLQDHVIKALYEFMEGVPEGKSPSYQIWWPQALWQRYNGFSLSPNLARPCDGAATWLNAQHPSHLKQKLEKNLKINFASLYKSGDENQKQNSNDNGKAFYATQKGNKNVALDIKNVDIRCWSLESHLGFLK